MFCIIFSIYALAQQQTYTIMLVLKNKLLAAAAIVAFNSITITLASGTVRTMRGLPEWLYYLTYVTQPRYAGAFLNQQIFQQYDQALPILKNITRSCNTNAWSEGCLYVNGTHYLEERYFNGGERIDLNYYLNFGICFAFPVIAFIVNLVFYSIPLPGLVKSKFRE